MPDDASPGDVLCSGSNLHHGECGQLPRMPEFCGPDVLGHTGSGDDMQIDTDGGYTAPCLTPKDDMNSPVVPAPTVSQTAVWTCPAVATPIERNVNTLDPLLQLQAKSLLNLHAPQIDNLQQFQAVATQTTFASDRIALLKNQGSLMADDELRFHLGRLVTQRNSQLSAAFPQVAVAIDPLLITSWIGVSFQSGLEWWQSVKPLIPDHFVLVSIVRLGSHWVPLQLFQFRKTLHIFTWDTPNTDHAPLGQIYEKFCRLLGCNNYVIDRTDRLFDCQDHCGAMALSYLRYVLLRIEVAHDPAAVVAYHQSLRDEFAEAIQGHQLAPKPWLWGDGSDALTNKLTEVLKEPGVPKELSLARAQSAIKVLGEKEVSIALQHSMPWKQLKQLGNNAKFQFVLPSELQAIVAANKGRPVGPKKSQKPRAKLAKRPEETTLDPTKLYIMEGTFRCNGHVVPQVGLNQVGPMVAGVILTDAKEAAPFLRGTQPVSSEPLALLILGDMPEATKLPQSSVSVPCTCAVNKEPVLADAVMIQLGQQHVVKHEAPNAIILDQIDVTTIKFTIFRDETEDAWKEVQRSPVRYLVNHFPLLKLCVQENCNCNAWHNRSKLATHEVIQDVWRRQFLTKMYKPCKPQDAYCYSVCLRIPAELRTDLLAQSGHAGTYLEPRTHDAKQVDEDYVVVWAPKLTHSELQVMRQTRPAIIGLARVQERKGLRVLATQAQGIHDLDRPGTMYLPQGPKLQWLCGPFPYGSDRVAISKALEQIQWRARPLQPMMPCPGKGTMWLIVSVESPPASIIQMAHGEIVLSRHKATSTEASTPKLHPVATAETLALCEPKVTKPQASGVDLLQIHDPWKPPPGLANPSMAPSAKQSMKELEDRIESAVLAKIQAAPSNMESDDVTDRLTALENQVGGIMSKQTQLEATVQESTAQQTSQLGSMQSQINQQSQQLHGAFESVKQSMQASMQGMFEAQMQQLRQLLAKRTREEGHE